MTVNAKPTRGGTALENADVQVQLQTNLELYLEALKLSDNLMESLVESGEVDLVDIHFQKLNE